MDIQLYDTMEDDGQLSLFGMNGQGIDEPRPMEPEIKDMELKEPEIRQPEGEAQEPDAAWDVRIRCCSSCGKLLFVREEGDAFLSECNNCGVRYCQRK